ncbi:MAG: heavy metal-binding domain-containing protein [Candidatus Dormibacteraceae bacterium]
MDATAVAARALGHLEKLKPGGGGNRTFTSDLSVDELLLVEEAGFEPLELVVGSSIYHVGFQFMGWNQSQELTVLSQAMYQARELAMGRMESEADGLGADGIVGVRLEIDFEGWGGGLAEFIAIGTAIKSRRGSLRTPRGRVFTSDLSGQDFWTLLRSGHRPLGLVMGTCVYHVAAQGLGRWLGMMGNNVELSNFTEAMYRARELAMGRMQAEALAVDAEGIVGVNLHERSHVWGGHTIEFFAVGTAVMPRSEGEEIVHPELVLPLDR